MDLSNLKAPKDANRDRKRVGRGAGSTWGKTAGKGQKGQNSRAGGGVRPGFEGGQMPLQMRLPKRGFTNPFTKEIATLNVRDLENFFEDGDVVSLETLTQRGLIPARFVDVKDDEGKVIGQEVLLKVDAVKILGDGELTKSLTVRVHRYSKSARAKIEAAGGAAVDFLSEAGAEAVAASEEE